MDKVYSISIIIENHEVKYFINNFKHYASTTDYGSGGSLGEKKPQCKACLISQKNWSFIKVDTHMKINRLIDSLKDSIDEHAFM